MACYQPGLDSALAKNLHCGGGRHQKGNELGLMSLTGSSSQIYWLEVRYEYLITSSSP